MKRLLAVLSGILLLLLFIVVLQRTDVISMSAPMPELPVSIQESVPVPEQKSVPVIAPEPEPIPEPECPVQPELGSPRLFNGNSMETVVVDEMQYVKAEQLATAMCLEATPENDSVMFSGYPRTSYFTVGNCNAVVNGEDILLNRAPFLFEDEIYLPLDESACAMGCTAYTDEETGVQYLTSGGGDWEIPADVHIPILEYHAVGNNIWGITELFMDPKEMEAQLAYLVNNGYDPIWFEDLRHVEQYDKPVILTFDDGYDDNYLELFPLLKKYNVKATIFVIAGVIGNNHFMTAEQISEMASSGLVSIQSHGMTHHELGYMDESSLRYEYGESKRILAGLTGAEPYVLCYPVGSSSELAVRIGREYFKFATKMSGKYYDTSTEPLLAPRYYISRYTTLEQFVAKLEEAQE